MWSRASRGHAITPDLTVNFAIDSHGIDKVIRPDARSPSVAASPRE